MLRIGKRSYAQIAGIMKVFVGKNASSRENVTGTKFFNRKCCGT